MELSKQSYIDVIKMPVNMLSKYLEWKLKYDRDIAKMKVDKLEQI